MTRPEEPVDPWATVDRPARTVNFGNPTVHLGDPDATVNLTPPPPPAGHPATVHPATVYPSAGHPATVYPPAGHQSPAEGTVRAQRELRFGPGVPAAPAPNPSWPDPAPAKRPRPVWRRVVSLLSSLLTLVLVGVVGFYIWQRLSPLEIEGVTVAVAQPAGNRCDVTVDVVATVRTNGRSGVIRYQWFRSDAPPGAVLTEQLGSDRSTATLTLKWTFNGVGATTETATVNIIEPAPIQSGTQVEYRCRRG
ncbi:hypothetical protein AB0G04_25550 [Actinoplanes sp. NPDC023801]|uniref:hypothetical protein n=1 Tax=Actinoplanes sp. NPDC023801 TaxID=3154595 RepID=UPI0033FFA331